jgi:IS4 transposase
MVAYIDPASKKELVFVTNLFAFKPLTISILYKKRWMVEPLFKQIKQYFELTYFLANSEEGIKTQLRMAKILNLLFTVIHKMTKEAVDFSTMVKLAAKNLYRYVNLIAFIKNPKNVRKATRENIGIIQLLIFENTRGWLF